jgi:anaerobic selenocysteine-containing dehydrogenase
MDRRSFIKVTAASGASATLAGCGNPETQLIRFIPDEPLLPGIATMKPSICPSCSAGCGLQVRVMDGDAEVLRNGQAGIIRMGLARKLEGNPAHPINRGRLCARGQAAIQITYHPDRIRHPMKRTGPRGIGPFTEISWEEAMTTLVSKLSELAATQDQKSLGFLSRPLRGQRQVLISEFLERFGAPSPIAFESFGEEVLREANARSFGQHQLPTFDLARARYLLSFGADFLGTWNSPVAQSIAFGEMRQGRPGIRGKFVQAESRMSQTGANADEWVPVKPGTEGVLALGIAHVILASRFRTSSQAGRAGMLIDGWDGGLPAYSPSAVEMKTGVASSRIERLAREFAENAPAVAMIGGAPLAHTNGLFQAVAVNALNALVDSVEQPGGIFFTPRSATEDRSASRSLDAVAKEILDAADSPIKLLLLHEANPVYGTPSAWRVREALERIPFVISFGTFLDETSMLADLLLPDHSFLESWVDDVPEAGTTMSTISVAPPAMKPLHQTRALPDVLLEAAQKIPMSRPLTWKTYEDVLQDALKSNWTVATQQGGFWSEASTRAPQQNSVTRKVTPAGPLFDGADSDYPFHFLPYVSQAFLDGSMAHLPWLQELPDAVSTAMWSSWVEINPKTAARLNIQQGNLVEVKSSQGTLQAPALISPGIAPDVIAMPAGQGHTTFTRYASGRGSNPISILAPLKETETGALAWAATRVRVSKIVGKGELVLFAGGLREEEERHR